jgi:hypothetical protein
VRLLVEEPLLELLDQRLPLVRRRRPRLLVVEVVEDPVLVPPVVGRVLVRRD